MASLGPVTRIGRTIIERQRGRRPIPRRKLGYKRSALAVYSPWSGID